MACIFAHYEKNGFLGASTKNLLQYLQTHVTHVIFVSTNISAGELKNVPAGVDVIVRENIGYDFYSYKVGLNRLSEIEQYDHICFLNNSFVCTDPEKLMQRVFSQSDDSADMFGLTFSREINLHIQSYFLVFTRQALQSDLLQHWWENVTPINERLAVIEAYELGLTTFLLENEFTLSAIFNASHKARFDAMQHAMALGLYQPTQLSDGTRSISTELAEQLNPTHFMWKELWEMLGIIKRELLIKNPYKVDLSEFSIEQLESLRAL